MSHIVEVDQSIKIEHSGATVLAFSNSISRAVIIPLQVKTQLLSFLHEKGKTKETSRLLLFAAGIYLLLKPHLSEITRIIIDKEYPGKEENIKSFLLEYIRTEYPTFDKNKIIFQLIGKSSPADKKARLVRKKLDKEFKRLTLTELLKVLI